jgi:indole-3-glycerol phosphate synthase
MLGPDQVAVAASGIRERKDIKMGLQAGIHNFLVGESLVRASDPAGMVQVLKGIKKPEG